MVTLSTFLLVSSLYLPDWGSTGVEREREDYSMKRAQGDQKTWGSEIALIVKKRIESRR